MTTPFACAMYCSHKHGHRYPKEALQDVGSCFLSLHMHVAGTSLLAHPDVYKAQASIQELASFAQQSQLEEI